MAKQPTQLVALRVPQDLVDRIDEAPGTRTAWILEAIRQRLDAEVEANPPPFPEAVTQQIEVLCPRGHGPVKNGKRCRFCSFKAG